MSIESPDFLKHFGEIKFAEENSMCINDYELALKKHVFGKKKIPSGHYKFGEIDNTSIKDFKRSLKNYFW
ncbi:MAG: hypothetical protein KGD58_03395 [Candidatus Lokiarchaeota archaeon]|nr:hypothetical protein [Candidatus Lokiarchaeota archaeon]